MEKSVQREYAAWCCPKMEKLSRWKIVHFSMNDENGLTFSSQTDTKMHVHGVNDFK